VTLNILAEFTYCQITTTKNERIKEKKCDALETNNEDILMC